jgi:alkanesulfonate monooxygenase SsuD/methylene tetrahydromethanopterin reductase-like flavin-dependent oxidoreductase (luciferase family)
MAERRVGVEIPGSNVREVLEDICQVEALGIQAAWLTTGGPKTADNNIRRDTPSILAAAAMCTRTIQLGTAIVLTWPRHPLSFVEYCETMAQLAPGRFRLGVGPGNKAPIERTYGFVFERPLGHLTEYVRIVRSVLREGAVDFDGHYYRAQTRDNEPVDVPVMISAVRPKSFELAGRCTDGAISWLCPGSYLRDFAVPAMIVGAEAAGQPTPPLVAHVALSIHKHRDEVEVAARERFDSYMRRDPYVEMYQMAGFAEAEKREWSTSMLKALVVSGDEAEAETRLLELFSFGATEIVVSVLPAGTNVESSRLRTLRFLGEFACAL